MSGLAFPLAQPLGGAEAPTVDGTAADDVYGRDLVFQGGLVSNGAGDYAVVAGIENLKNSITRRLFTRRGEYRYRPEYGCGVPSYLKRKMTASVLDQLKHDIVVNLGRDRRIASVDAVALTPFQASNGSQCLAVQLKIKAFGRTITYAPPTFTEVG